MKKTTFKCDPLQPGAMIALQSHRDANPNGANCYGGRSMPKCYRGFVVYETKSTIVVDSMSGYSKFA